MGERTETKRRVATRNPIGRGITLAGGLVKGALLGLFAGPSILLYILLEGSGRGLRWAGRSLLRASGRWYRFSAGVIDSVR